MRDPEVLVGYVMAVTFALVLILIGVEMNTPLPVPLAGLR